MSWINVSKKMGLGKGLACFSLLLLMLLHLQITTPCCAANKFSRFKSEAAAAASSNSDKSTTSINGRFKGKELDGDEIFGADKRKVNTGPNPLHNR